MQIEHYCVLESGKSFVCKFYFRYFKFYKTKKVYVIVGQLISTSWDNVF